MRIAHVLLTDAGGAGCAAVRLHRGLRLEGVTSRMVVEFTGRNDVAGICGHNSKLDRVFGRLVAKVASLPKRMYGKEIQNWSLNVAPRRSFKRVLAENPDVVNLHWLGEGFFPVRSLHNLPCPVVWTLHDMWAFTGGCHYDQECGRYRTGCGKCPQLGSSWDNDLSRWNLRYKKAAFASKPVTIVAPSRWLAECARTSLLFRGCRVEEIPYGLDLDEFQAHDKCEARKRLGIPAEKRIVLFGAANASDPRKGARFLRSALERIPDTPFSRELHVVTFGSRIEKDLADLPITYSALGKLAGSSQLSLAYSAADVFVAPSLQDNLPNTVLESLACGTPVVAFQVGGMTDMIEHQRTGYLAESYSSHDLARGICWSLGNSARRMMLSTNSRKKAESCYSIRLQAQRYINLYRSLEGGPQSF